MILSGLIRVVFAGANGGENRSASDTLYTAARQKKVNLDLRTCISLGLTGTLPNEH